MTPRGHVLIVDDEPAVLDTLGDMLGDLGYEVSRAVNGEEAIAAMTETKPQVVLLDLLMPGISGLEALAYFRQHHRRVPVIVISASLTPDVSRQVRARGAFDALSKPVALESLANTVGQAMRLASRA